MLKVHVRHVYSIAAFFTFSADAVGQIFHGCNAFKRIEKPSIGKWHKTLHFYFKVGNVQILVQENQAIAIAYIIFNHLVYLPFKILIQTPSQKWFYINQFV
jgi:hypothetical protein